MTVKKVFLNYQSKITEIISQWHDELKIGKSLNDHVQLLLSKATSHKENSIMTIWKVEGYQKPNAGFLSRDALENGIRKSYAIQDRNITWLTSFITDKLILSQTEPVNLTFQQHNWYMPVFRDGPPPSNIEPVLVHQDFYHHDSFTSSEKFDFLWLYQDEVYGIKGVFSYDAQKLLVLEDANKERRKFEKLKNKFSGKESDEVKYERSRIPEEVRIAVWRRDQGKCARCGNRENLEYDHIVPISKGGGNTVRNIELLCQDCNRSKGNRIE